MNLDDVHDGMTVRITKGGPDHPLHGHRAEVILVTAPLPDPPPESLRDPSVADLIHLADSNRDDPLHRRARAFRKDILEAPFAWPHGQVLLSLRAPVQRRWPFPYVTVSPDDIEAVS